MHSDAPESEPGLTRRARRADAPAFGRDQAFDSSVARSSVESETRAARRRAAAQTATHGPEDRAALDAAALDAFEAAARVFSFTAENPVVAPTSPVVSEPSADASSATHAAPTRRVRRGGMGVKRVAAAGFSMGVMAAVGLLTVAVTVPAEAVAAATQAVAVTSIVADTEDAASRDEIQAFVAPESADTDLNRDEKYSTATFSEIAAATGISRHTNFFVNDPGAPIQWPFAVGVPISDGYGPRWGSFHYGLDFTPGEGADIQAVAAGTVRVANESGGAFGVHVMVDHEINGEVFSTHYAHMLYGSLQVKVGDVVEAGTVLGHVGDTGLSYGSHLHFEVFVNEARIDPLAWLREHAGG